PKAATSERLCGQLGSVEMPAQACGVMVVVSVALDRDGSCTQGVLRNSSPGRHALASGHTAVSYGSQGARWQDGLHGLPVMWPPLCARLAHRRFTMLAEGALGRVYSPVQT